MPQVDNFKAFLEKLKEEGQEYDVDINIGTKTKLYNSVKNFWTNTKPTQGVSLPQIIQPDNLVDFTLISQYADSLNLVKKKIIAELGKYDCSFLDGLWGKPVPIDRVLVPQYMRDVGVIDSVVKFHD